MPKTRPFFEIWLRHIIVGLPLAAFLHSVVQFAFDTGASLSALPFFLLHFILGIVVGSVILIPAFTVQAALFSWLRERRVSTLPMLLLCGALQAGIVALWWIFVGLEPSLGGRFLMGPVMTGTAFLAGAVVAWLVRSRIGNSAR